MSRDSFWARRFMVVVYFLVDNWGNARPDGAHRKAHDREDDLSDVLGMAQRSSSTSVEEVAHPRRDGDILGIFTWAFIFGVVI